MSVEAEMGPRVARPIGAGDGVDHVAVAPGAALIFWTADPRVIGRTLADSELRAIWQLNLVAVRRAGQQTLDILVEPDYLVGPDAILAEFTTQALADGTSPVPVRRNASRRRRAASRRARDGHAILPADSRDL